VPERTTPRGRHDPVRGPTARRLAVDRNNWHLLNGSSAPFLDGSTEEKASRRGKEPGKELVMATNKKKLFITESMSMPGRALLRERGDLELVEFPNLISAGDFEAMLKAHAPVHGVALGATRFGEPELEASKEMEVVTRIGVGYDAVDVAALSRRKIPLMVAGTANSPSVAEQALFMMLTLAKRAVEMHALVKDGEWSTRLGKLPYDLFGKTVLIVGFGRIGTRTAKRCLAMEMNVLIYDPYKSADEIKAAGCEPLADLDAALPRVDFVSIHCPKTSETIGMFNAARLKRMKPSAYLINTARGAIVDEAALYDALSSGKLAGAGLDVFEQEPPPVGHSLFELPNVIIAPHVAGVTREAVDRMSEQTARNILSALDGEPIRQNVINQDILGGDSPQ
jgi:D-3-phosphoglycerate dehydrogenase / 2-oxoglutarate reductase